MWEVSSMPVYPFQGVEYWIQFSKRYHHYNVIRKQTGNYRIIIRCKFRYEKDHSCKCEITVSKLQPVCSKHWRCLFTLVLEIFRIGTVLNQPIPVTARSKSSVSGRALAGIVGSNPTGGAWMFVSCTVFMCCQVEVSATGRSLLQRNPTDCDVCLSVIKWK
jgi:hypothetical protein